MADRRNPQKIVKEVIRPSLAVDLSRNRPETLKAQDESVSIGEVLDAIWHMYRAHGAPLAKFHAKNFVSRALQAMLPAPCGTLKGGVAR
jgi:hypothetical protein